MVGAMFSCFCFSDYGVDVFTETVHAAHLLGPGETIDALNEQVPPATDRLAPAGVALHACCTPCRQQQRAAHQPVHRLQVATQMLDHFSSQQLDRLTKLADALFHSLAGVRRNVDDTLAGPGSSAAAPAAAGVGGQAPWACRQRCSARMHARQAGSPSLALAEAQAAPLLCLCRRVGMPHASITSHADADHNRLQSQAFRSCIRPVLVHDAQQYDPPADGVLAHHFFALRTATNECLEIK
jgi:hypothetical protein